MALLVTVFLKSNKCCVINDQETLSEEKIIRSLVLPCRETQYKTFAQMLVVWISDIVLLPFNM